MMRSLFKLNYSNFSDSYLTNTSKCPSSSMEKHNSPPLAGSWSLRLINPYRHIPKTQVLDEELLVCSRSPYTLHVPDKVNLTADPNLFQNLSLFKGKKNREFTQKILYFPK